MYSRSVLADERCVSVMRPRNPGLKVPRRPYRSSQNPAFPGRSQGFVAIHPVSKPGLVLTNSHFSWPGARAGVPSSGQPRAPS
jgi:hypothetical protein